MQKYTYQPTYMKLIVMKYLQFLALIIKTQLNPLNRQIEIFLFKTEYNLNEVNKIVFNLLEEIKNLIKKQFRIHKENTTIIRSSKIILDKEDLDEI